MHPTDGRQFSPGSLPVNNNRQGDIQSWCYPPATLHISRSAAPEEAEHSFHSSSLITAADLVAVVGVRGFCSQIQGGEGGGLEGSTEASLEEGGVHYR